jgi:hypothetical protein
MKRALIAAVCMSLAVAPALAAGQPNGVPPGLANRPGGLPPGQAKKWARGERIPVTYYSETRYFIVEPVRYQLAPPPPGHRWVLVDGDAYLVQTTDGLIANVVLNAVANLLR